MKCTPNTSYAYVNGKPIAIEHYRKEDTAYCKHGHFVNELDVSFMDRLNEELLFSIREFLKL